MDDGVSWALQPFDPIAYAPFGVMALKEEELVSDGESLHVAEQTWTELGHTAHRFLTLVAETDAGTAYSPGQPWLRVLNPDALRADWIKDPAALMSDPPTISFSRRALR
jgi:hypothetical protein